MSPELLTRIGEYELKEKLGQGGYGAVYKARDQLGRDVAIKILTAFGDDATTIEGFKKEATTLARLNHRNIVTVYQFGVDSGKPFVAMEYLQGQPLSAIIKAKREMHLVEKLDIIIQATEGLRHAHENKVIHRDIKPHNLMVVENSIVKLIDFGIAQGDGSKSQSRQEIAGSLPYMSPEHFVQKRTPWCDVFSMGVVLYEFLSGGSVPYASDRDDLPVAYHKLMSNDPAPLLSTHVPDLPPGLDEVVAKAIAKQKLNGYESAEEFLFELARIQESVKSDFVNQLLKVANDASNEQNYPVAHDLVERILRVDPNNAQARRKQFELKKHVQQHHRTEQLHAICVRVDEAIQSKKFDLAQIGLEEARQIAPESNTVKALQQKLIDIRQLQAQIENLIGEAQRHGSTGNWAPAEQAVEKALQLEASNTRALEFREAIRRAVAQEARIVEQARAALQEFKFQEAFELIRQAEAIAPKSERVTALKELAVNAYKEDERRREIAAATQSAQECIKQGNFSVAREHVEQALARYSDERSLLDLRAEIEKQQEEQARRQFVDEKVQAGKQALQAKKYVDAIALLEQAYRRVPDPTLHDLLVKAKEKAQEQVAEKRREQYLRSAKESMERGDAASAVVTLEMAQSEFGAGDQQVQSMLQEARTAADVEAKAVAEREAREAAEREEKAKRLAKEAAERQAINQAIEQAKGASQSGDFTAALKIVEQAASKFGMRPELSAAANQVKTARTADASAQIETLLDHAQAEADAKHHAGALQAIERAKPLCEFAAQKSVARLKTLEQNIRAAAKELESATRIFQKSGMEAAPAAPQQVAPKPKAVPTGGAAAAPAPAKEAEPAAQAKAQERVTTSRRAVPQPQPVVPPPSSNKMWIGIIAAVGVVIAVIAIYFVMSPSAVDVRFETDPAGSAVAVSGQQCQSPCSLKLKPGHYSVKVTHDQYASLDKEIDVTPKMGAVPLTLNPALGSATAPAVGSLALDINVAGADIFVDDQLKGTIKGKTNTLTVGVGTHQIRIEKQGFQPVTKPIDIAKDAQATLSFTLNPGSAAPGTPVDTYLVIKSVPNASIMVDTTPVGTVPADGTFSTKVAPGKHKVEATLAGYSPASKNVTAKEGARVPMDVSPKAMGPTVSFSADTTDIQAGKSATLKWDAQNAKEVSIDGLGTFPPSGSKSVSPTANTTYTLIASGPGGKSAAQRVTIKVAAAAAPPTPTVVAKPTIARFELGSDSIPQGGRTKLFWDVQNADSVSIDPEVGTVKPSSSTNVSPGKTTSYTLTAKGPGGTVSSQPLTLTVEAKAEAQQSTQTQQQPAQQAAPNDAQLVKQVLDRWRAAYESGNLGDARAIYPGISKGQAAGFSRPASVTDVSVSLSCNPTVSGDSAQASCTQVLSYKMDGKAQAPAKNSVSFTLKKAGGNWQIQSIR